jgi:hypothetical protein
LLLLFIFLFPSIVVCFNLPLSICIYLQNYI